MLLEARPENGHEARGSLNESLSDPTLTEVNGNWHYFLTDALGTVRDVVDDSGTVIQSYEFNEHGIPMPGSGASSGTFSPKTYQGALSVNDDRNDSGLYLMGHRHFAAELGRFISRDPIGFAGGLNLFNGAGTSPVTMVDPSGLDLTVVYTDSSDRGWATKKFNYYDLWNAGKWLKAHDSEIIGLINEGHGNNATCGIDKREGHQAGFFVSKGHLALFWEKDWNKKGSEWEYDYLEGLKLENLRFITTKSCSSAGGAPDAAQRRRPDLYGPGGSKEGRHDPYYMDPYDPNNKKSYVPVAIQLSKAYPKAVVTGNLGPHFFGYSSPYRPIKYQNGVVIP